MSAQPETWRVSTIEGVFEADLDTLRQWILEGCVQPTDKVTKGNLNWIEAGKAPMLRSAFAGERVQVSVPAAPAIVEDHFAAPPEATPINYVQEVSYAPEFGSTDQGQNTFADDVGSPDVCHNHPEVATKYVCWSCMKGFCEECSNFVAGRKIPLCAICGDLCKEYSM